MKPVEIKGIIPPVITPMGPDEEVNLEELRRQVERLLESGVHGIFCFGTNGEGAQREQESLASFRQCFQYGGSGTVIKAAVAMLGYDVGRCRAPFHLLPQEGAAALKRVLEENREKGMG